jgi:hypothetical protein
LPLAEEEKNKRKTHFSVSAFALKYKVFLWLLDMVWIALKETPLRSFQEAMGI